MRATAILSLLPALAFAKSDSLSSASSSASSASFVAASKASSVSSLADKHISSVISQAQDAGSYATAAAASQINDLQALVSELVYGKEPTFVESVMSRYSKAVYTSDNYLSSASSSASVYAASASSYAASASSYAASMASSLSKENLPTALPSLEDIYSNLDSQIQGAVSAASVQFYGSKKGIAEQASSSASSAYDEASKTLSSMVYGTTNYAELAQASIAAAASSAQEALSIAIYGKKPGYYDNAASVLAQATSVVGDTVNQAVSSASSAASIVGKSAASHASVASKAVYGPEDGSFESATLRLAAAVETAQAKLKEFVVAVGEGATEKAAEAMSSVSSMGSSISSQASKVASSASSAAKSARDEL